MTRRELRIVPTEGGYIASRVVSVDGGARKFTRPLDGAPVLPTADAVRAWIEQWIDGEQPSGAEP